MTRSMLNGAHGRARESSAVVVELPKPAELSDAVPAPPQPPLPPPPYKAGDPNAKLAGSRGGKTRARRKREAKSLGIGPLAKLADEHPFAAYDALGRDYELSLLSHISRDVGGGQVHPDAAACARIASKQLAWGMFVGDVAQRAGQVKLMLSASRLLDSSRQNLLACFELASRSAGDAHADPIEALKRRMAAVQLPPAAPPDEEGDK